MPYQPSDHNGMHSSGNKMINITTARKIPKHIETKKYTSTQYKPQKQKTQEKL